MSKSVEKIEENIIKISGSANLREISREIPGYELLVEPLSEKVSISDFIFEGGLGYNSLKEGSFSSKIFGLKTKSGGIDFSYGLNHTTLYQTGYLLQRIIEGTSIGITPVSFEPIEELIIPIRKKEEKEVFYLDKNIEEIFISDSCDNVLWLNNPAAKLFGLEKSGIIMTIPKELSIESGVKLQDTWEKRFVEDKLNKNILKIFTQKSKIKTIYESLSKENLFLSLFTNKGVLILVSGEEKELEQVKIPALKLPLTYCLKE